MIVCVRVLCFSVIVMCYSGTVVWLYVLMCQGTVHVRVLDWCVCPQGHIGGIQCLQFDQRRLVTGGADRSVRLWDVRSGRSVHKFYGHRVRRNRPGVASICIMIVFFFLSGCCWFSFWATTCGCCHSLCVIYIQFVHFLHFYAILHQFCFKYVCLSDHLVGWLVS